MALGTKEITEKTMDTEIKSKKKQKDHARYMIRETKASGKRRKGKRP